MSRSQTALITSVVLLIGVISISLRTFANEDEEFIEKTTNRMRSMVAPRSFGRFGPQRSAESYTALEVNEEEIQGSLDCLFEEVLLNAKEIAGAGKHGHLLYSPIVLPVSDETNTEMDSACTAPVGLTDDTFVSVARRILNSSSVSFQTPYCATRNRRLYSFVGGACIKRTRNFLATFYDKGILLMALGATKDEAFGPFLHFRILAANLKACQPSLNPPRFTALPDSYAHLYELYETRLIARLHESKRLRRAPGARGHETLLDQFLILKQEAISVSPDNVFDTENLLPGSLNRLEYALPLSGRQKRLKELSVSSRITEEQCNAGLTEAQYFVHQLDTYTDAYENCCAAPCLLVGASTRTPGTPPSTCCIGCNRASCAADSAGDIVSLASVAVIASPPKDGTPPATYTIVL